MSSPLLSVVIPTLNEAGSLGALLGDLRGLSVPYEVIIADGGSTDGTTSIARSSGAIVATSDAGRGRQLRAGVARASAELLCVLHADVRLPTPTVHALDALANGAAHGATAFRLRIDAAGWRYRLVERGANLRSSMLRLPYGDQGLVVQRELYDEAGGFADVPLMEDVMLVRALHRRGYTIDLHEESVTVSARRWQRDGVLRRSAANMTLLARWLLGASPESLVRRYERTA